MRFYEKHHLITSPSFDSTSAHQGFVLPAYISMRLSGKCIEAQDAKVRSVFVKINYSRQCEDATYVTRNGRGRESERDYNCFRTFLFLFCKSIS